MANILVVDDHPDGREFLSTLLGYRGHHVSVARDGEEALGFIRDAPPDLVVSDILMPKVDGYELVRRMRADPSVASTPVIFYTAAYEDEPARALATSVGVLQFLQKPSDPQVILKIIDGVLGTDPATSVVATTPASFEREHLTLLTTSLAARVNELQEEIAERTRAEERVRCLNEELSAANIRLLAEIKEREAAQEQLIQARKIESLGELTGGIAHDFNNLLTVVIGSLELIQKRNDDIKLVRLVDGAQEAARRGARLTQQLLAFARRQRLEPTALDLAAIVNGMAGLLGNIVGVGISIRIKPTSVKWQALGDRNQVEMVLMNLAANARDAMADNGELTIAIAQRTVTQAEASIDLTEGDYVAITMTDTGVGMTPEVLGRAIEPFFTTKAIGKGTGLGLSMVHGVAKQSGGTMLIDSQVGRGTTVTILLPRTFHSTRDAGPPPAQASTACNGRILLVDDDDQVRDIAHEFLEELGFDVAVADCGRAAIAFLTRKEHVDLLMIDFAMPEMNGIEAVRHIRSMRPALPVLFLTGYSTGLDLADLTHASVLRKPFQLADLDRAVSAALQARH